MHKKVLVVLIVMVSFLFQALFAAPQMKAVKQQEGQKTGILNMIPDLSDAQKQKIKALLKEEQKKIKEIREQYSQKIKQILTPEQLKSLQNEVANRMLEKKVSRLAKVLNLSIDQQYKVKSIYKKYQNQLKLTKDKQSKKEILNKINKEIKTILTDNQKARFEKMEKILKKVKQHKQGAVYNKSII